MSEIRSLPRQLLGLHKDREDILAYKSDASLVTVAKNGSGKDRCVILPNLVTFPGSIIITDPKGEDAENAAAWRASSASGLAQPVHVFDPFGQCNPDLLPRGCLAKFNPLDFIRESKTPAEDAMQIAAAVVTASDREPQWAWGAQALFAMAAVFVALDPYFPGPRTMRTVWNVLSYRGEALNEFLSIVSLSEVADGFPAREARAFLENSNEKGKDSYLMTLKTSCGAIFNSPAILDNMDETTVDFGSLTRRPASVFLVLPGKFAQTHGRWFRVLLSCAFAQMEGSGLVANENKGPGVVFVLNEFFSLGKFDQIVEAMGRMRNYGIKFWTFVQNLSQLKILYGEGWTNITGTADVVQYFGGTLDTFTAEYISALSGKKTVLGEGGSQNFGPGGSETASQSETGRPVRMPDEIMRIEAGTQWISRAGANAYPGRMLYIDKDFPAHAAFMRDLKSRARPYTARHGFGAAAGSAANGVAKPAPGAPNFTYKPSPFAAFKATVGDLGGADKFAPAARSDGFRPCKPGEVFPPGCEFRVNVSTGEKEVRMA